MISPVADRIFVQNPHGFPGGFPGGFPPSIQMIYTHGG